MQVPVLNLAGEAVGQVELSDRVFGVPLNEALLHQAVVYYRNNLRQGTHDTKTRAEVRGGGSKPYRQKGTGRARQGSIRAPHYRGGGVVFGPHPRSYKQDFPRRMRRLAIKMALSAKAAANQVIVVEDFDLEAPRTKDMVAALEAWGVDGRSALVVMGRARPNIIRSLRNIPKVQALPANSLGVLALLSHRALVLSRDAVDVIHSQFGVAESAVDSSPAAVTPASVPAGGRGETAAAGRRTPDSEEEEPADNA